MKTIADQLKNYRSPRSVWRKAFDSKEDRIIYIRKAFSQFHISSDIWLIRGSAQQLYSSPGTMPLYVTMVE